jgi:uncharacterized protein YdaU (DUF1376 family)
MNDNHWYPRDPARYLTDTAWCDAATEVAHNRLIDTYYALGKPIKDDQSRIQLIGKIKDTDYARVRGNLAELGWRFEGGELRHKRIEEVMAETAEKREERVLAGRLGAAARWQKDGNRIATALATASQPQCDGNADANGKTIVTTTTTTTTDTDTTKGSVVASLPAPRVRFEKPSLEAVKLQAAKIGLPDSEAERFFNYYTSNGWKVGRVAMVSWVHALTNWKKGATQATSGANTVILGKEYERVTARMNTLRQTYGDHQTWTQQDREELNKLRTRKAQLKQQLGIMV